VDLRGKLRSAAERKWDEGRRPSLRAAWKLGRKGEAPKGGERQARAADGRIRRVDEKRSLERNNRDGEKKCDADGLAGTLFDGDGAGVWVRTDRLLVGQADAEQTPQSPPGRFRVVGVPTVFPVPV
jgi:hypothetical protein